MTTDPFRADPAALTELADHYEAFRPDIAAARHIVDAVLHDPDFVASRSPSPETWDSAQRSLNELVVMLRILGSSVEAAPGLLRSCAEGYLAGDRFAAELLRAIAAEGGSESPPLTLTELAPTTPPPPSALDLRPQAAILRPDRPMAAPPFRLDRFASPAVEFGARVAGIRAPAASANSGTGKPLHVTPVATHTAGGTTSARSSAPTPSASSASGGGRRRAEILKRAKRWADLGLGYSMSRTFEGYRMDCSGMVSMAWGLPAPGLTTDTMPQVAHPIGKADLLPGDVLVNTAPGAAGHTLIFAGWADEAHTRYFAYEESGGKGAHYGTVPYPYWRGHGTFRPYRLNSLGD